jgi:pantoate--beta-alanine ligase
MGALHEGHLRLVDLARKKADVVVMSIYVNPTQFGPREDFSKYPRPLARDRKLASARGVDYLFHPENLYYPDASIHIHEADLSKGRCGASRPGHFDGVVTVVAKLFNIVQPDFAVFGQKDGQQLDVIERLVRDLNFPVKILRAPIVRDSRGLALSSRNRYLSPEGYERAVAFAGALRDHSRDWDAHSRSLRRLTRRLQSISGLEIDYLEVVQNRIFAAVRIEETRLIDNRPLQKKSGL